jgi:hypothetical protein
MVMQDPEIDQDSLDLLAEHGQALTNEVERLRQSHIPNHITEETFAMFETVFGETIPGDATLWGYTKHACAEVERLRRECDDLEAIVGNYRTALLWIVAHDQTMRPNGGDPEWFAEQAPIRARRALTA